jgi:hypothetical protein
MNGVETVRAARIVEIFQRKVDELCEAVIAELRQPERPGETSVEPTQDQSDAANDTDSSVWSLAGASFRGSWEETARQQGVTYRWPDGNIDDYPKFVSYRGTDAYSAMRLALGYDDAGNVVGFILSPKGTSKRGLTCFFPADDSGRTNEMVSMIRGGGPRGRGGFGPGEALPHSYGGFKTDILRDRVAGKWNVQAVVALADDPDVMLAHTALQARLRGLA